MVMNRFIAGAMLVLGLSAGVIGTVSAAAPHGHDGHSAPAMELTLDNGRKWQTDEALRTGMDQIRAAFDAALPRIHEGRYSAAEYAALAGKVQEQVDYVVANCKLPEEADQQLHVALTQVLDGVNAMKEDSGQDKGAVTILQALNAYGEHFDHPGWEPLGH